MSFITINDTSTDENIELFYTKYKTTLNYKTLESTGLCYYLGKPHIDFIGIPNPNTVDKTVFINSIRFCVNQTQGLGYVIIYTHNTDDIITCLSITQLMSNDCDFICVKYLCSNSAFKLIPPERSYGYKMLDFIFGLYTNKIILIEPANTELIEYYVKYKTPSFPYDAETLNITSGFLIYGRILKTSVDCFRILKDGVSWMSDAQEEYLSTPNLIKTNELYRLINQYKLSNPNKFTSNIQDEPLVQYIQSQNPTILIYDFHYLDRIINNMGNVMDGGGGKSKRKTRKSRKTKRRRHRKTKSRK